MEFGKIVCCCFKNDFNGIWASVVYTYASFYFKTFLKGKYFWTKWGKRMGSGWKNEKREQVINNRNIGDWAEIFVQNTDLGFLSSSFLPSLPFFWFTETLFEFNYLLKSLYSVKFHSPSRIFERVFLTEFVTSALSDGVHQHSRFFKNQH